MPTRQLQWCLLACVARPKLFKRVPVWRHVTHVQEVVVKVQVDWCGAWPGGTLIVFVDPVIRRTWWRCS